MQKSNLTLKIALTLACVLMLGSCGSRKDVQDSSLVANDSSTIAPSTTLSAADQTAADEQLIREVFYEGQQLLGAVDIDSEIITKFRNYEKANLFPPYRQFLTDALLDSCIASEIDNYSSWTASYVVPQLDSSISTPDWILEISTGKTFQPSEYGRTYMIRVRSVNVGDSTSETESDIHFSIIDGKAYYFTNFDYCLTSS